MSFVPTSQPRVLIVDDEVGIRKSLEGALADEGYQIRMAANAQEAFDSIASEIPDAVLLDIWMPGIDGLEALQQIRTTQPGLPIIIMSGHASIATAVKATQEGAFDFLEKPLDLKVTLDALNRALSKNNSQLGEQTSKLTPIVFQFQRESEGRPVQQKTLTHTAVLYGQGLHSGQKSGLMLEPLPAGSGIHFSGIPVSTPVPAHIDFVESTGFATTVKLGSTQAGTIEHLMSALHVYGITNLLVKCNGEVPVMDGSSQEFCALFDQIGVANQESEQPLFDIRVSETIRVGDEKEFIQIEPSDTFIIDYTLKYPEPLGHQHMVFEMSDVAAYKSQIAPARTFGFVRDVGALQRQGLALGGRFDNFVLFGEEGPINCTLRFPNEPVRHKILDAIGDLYLLGRPLRGKVTAVMTGHSDNIALLKAIKHKLLSSQIN